MSNIPDWFNLERYRDHESLEEWAYDIWVRSHFYIHASFFNTASFDIREHPAYHHDFAVMCGLGLPVCTGNYKKFLENREFFREYFLAQKEIWSLDVQKKKPAIEMYDIDDIFISEDLEKHPDMVNRDDFVLTVSIWCERNRPFGINLGKTDEELLKAFKKYLKQCRDDEKKFFALSKNVSEKASKWHGEMRLAQFDLLYWREVCDKSLTHAQLAQAIWPEKHRATMDVEQNLRKHGMDKINEVFSTETAKSLYFEHLKTV